MATIWITYAWDDNRDGDVDYIAQELQLTGLKVKLDRQNLRAGLRLWDQICEFIQSPEQCDAWLIVATQASLGSEACKEEYAYALDRALHTRGGTFPVVALFPSTVDDALIPAGIRTRLYVSLCDTDWKERIVAAAEGRTPEVTRAPVKPYRLALHKVPGQEGVVVELAPRAGTWSPFIVAVPASERDQVRPSITYGPRGRVSMIAALFCSGEGTYGDWAFCTAQNEATPTMSYYLFCRELPSRLRFGVDGGEQYEIKRPASPGE